MDTANFFETEANLPEELRGRVPTLRVIPMVADSNPSGDIFGGWILSQMDLAGASHAHLFVRGRIVTVGIEAISFHKPVFLGDQVSFYTKVFKVGTTSVTIKVESWALRSVSGTYGYIKVTEGLYTYVHIDETRKPKKIKHDQNI